MLYHSLQEKSFHGVQFPFFMDNKKSNFAHMTGKPIIMAMQNSYFYISYIFLIRYKTYYIYDNSTLILIAIGAYFTQCHIIIITC